MGIGRYAVEVPPDALRGHKQALLRVRYVGDVGHAFVHNEMISDNFANGAAWDIRLDCYADALSRAPLTIYITPIKQGVTVDVSSAMAGRLEKVNGLTAELFSAELILVDEISLNYWATRSSLSAPCAERLCFGWKRPLPRRRRAMSGP